MANQIFGRYTRCCRTFLRTRRSNLPMQIRCTYASDAKDGDKSNKNITGDQSVGKAVDSHKTEGNDSQFNAGKRSDQDKTKSQNILLKNTLRVHATYENKFKEKPTNPSLVVEKQDSSKIENKSKELQATELDKKKTNSFSKITEDGKNSALSTENQMDKKQPKRTDVTSKKSVSAGISTKSKDEEHQCKGQEEPFDNIVSAKQKIKKIINEAQVKVELDKKKGSADSSKFLQDLKKDAKSTENQVDKNHAKITEVTSNKSVSNVVSTESKDKVQQSLHQGKPSDNTVTGKQKIKNIKFDKKKRSVDSSKLTKGLKKNAKSTENQVDKNHAKRSEVTSKKSVSNVISTESKDKVQESLHQGKPSENTVTEKQKIKNIKFDKKKRPVDSSQLSQDLKKDAKSTENQLDTNQAKITEVTSNKSDSDGKSTESKDKVQPRLRQWQPSEKTVSGKHKIKNIKFDKKRRPVGSSKLTQVLKKDAKSTENQLNKNHAKITEVISNKSDSDGISIESKDKVQQSLCQGETSDNTVSEKRKVENMSRKLQEKLESEKTKESIDLISIIRGQCDIIEKLRSKFDKINQADSNNMSTLKISEGTGKSSASNLKSQSSENSLPFEKNINNDKLETIKIMGGVPESVEKATKARKSRILQRKYDTINNKNLEGVKIFGGIPKTVARKDWHTKVSQRISEKTSGQYNKTPKKKIRGKAFIETKPTETVKVNPNEKPVDLTDITSTVRNLNNEQLKSKEITKKFFNLSYISQQDINKWKKMEADSLTEGKPVAMSVDKIPQRHLAKTLGKDFSIKNKYFTFDQILAMTDNKFKNKKMESNTFTESNPRVENADIYGKKGMLSFEKTKETSDSASKKEGKDQKDASVPVHQENPKTTNKMDEHIFSKTLKDTSDRFDKNPHKDREEKALHDSTITTKSSGDNITQSINNEFTKDAQPVDLTKKPLRGTVAVLLEANNRKRMEELSKSFNLQNEESLNSGTYQPGKFFDQSQENMAQEQSQKDIIRPTPCTKNENETSELLKPGREQDEKEYLNSVKSAPPDESQNTSFSFTRNTNFNVSDTTFEQSHEQTVNETVNPNIKAQSAIDVMISKIKEQKELSSKEVQSATPEKSQNTPYSYTPNTNLNASDAISELKKKIESIKKCEIMVVSKQSSPIDIKRNVIPSQFSSTDSNVNVENSEIKADCSLTPGDLYNSENETIKCDIYSESGKSEFGGFKLTNDILLERLREKKRVKNDKISRTWNEPKMDTYKEHNKTSAKNEESVDNPNEPDLYFSEPTPMEKSSEKVATDNYKGYNMIGDKKLESVDIEPDLYFSESKEKNESHRGHPEDNITFAEFFNQKLKELYKLNESKVEKNESKIEKNEAQLSDNLKKTPKEEYKAHPKEEYKAHLKPEKVSADEAKKTLSDYLFTLVKGNKNKPGNKRDFGTYSLAQNFGSSVFPRYWPLYWKRFTNRLWELIKKQPKDAFISPDLKKQGLGSMVIHRKRLEMWKILSGVNNIETKMQNSMKISTRDKSYVQEDRNSKIRLFVQETREKRFAHVNRQPQQKIIKEPNISASKNKPRPRLVEMKFKNIQNTNK